MKNIVVLLLAGLMCVSAFAQPAASPAPAKKSSAPAIVEPPVSIASGTATVNAKNVNVRTKAAINSEVVLQLNPGDTVTVIEQINLDKFKADEPRQWAKIALPEAVDVWIHNSFIDRTTMTVVAPKLNIRSGPGENHSVVGVIERGTQVKEVLTDGNWTRISAPSGTFAYIAAMYLQQDATLVTSETPATPVHMPEMAAAPEPVATVVPVDPEPTPVVASETEAASSAELMSMPAPSLQPAEPVVEPPPPPRIVSHEGVVTTTKSIQAPTEYQLIDPNTGQTVNYLHTTSTNLNLSLYRGLRIIVTGEEGLEARWKTPVITIRRIQVVE